MLTRVKTPEEIKNMRHSGQMLAQVLSILKSRVEPGISTKELADIAATELKSLGGKPAFLGYFGFPDVLCTSVNDEVVHGIPSAKKVLANGDIIGLDFGVNFGGMITDAAISVVVGKTSDQRLVDMLEDTRKSLYEGISKVKNGAHIGDISHAIEAYLGKRRLGIVRDLVGHGVGHELHEEPNIPNYGRKGTGLGLVTGMTIAIEPMTTLGGHEVYTDSDNWTIKTKDGSFSAHFEHTVLVTENGSEVLTQL